MNARGFLVRERRSCNWRIARSRIEELLTRRPQRRRNAAPRTRRRRFRPRHEHFGDFRPTSPAGRTIAAPPTAWRPGERDDGPDPGSARRGIQGKTQIVRCGARSGHRASLTGLRRHEHHTLARRAQRRAALCGDPASRTGASTGWSAANAPGASVRIETASSHGHLHKVRPTTPRRCAPSPTAAKERGIVSRQTLRGRAHAKGCPNLDSTRSGSDVWSAQRKSRGVARHYDVELDTDGRAMRFTRRPVDEHDIIPACTPAQNQTDWDEAWRTSDDRSRPTPGRNAPINSNRGDRHLRRGDSTLTCANVSRKDRQQATTMPWASTPLREGSQEHQCPRVVTSLGASGVLAGHACGVQICAGR